MSAFGKCSSLLSVWVSPEIPCFVTRWDRLMHLDSKVTLIGLPIAFEPGSLGQQLFGLLVAFISFGLFLSVRPFLERLDNFLEIVCQCSLFLAMLSGIALQQQPTGFVKIFVDILLCVRTGRNRTMLT